MIDLGRDKNGKRIRKYRTVKGRYQDAVRIEYIMRKELTANEGLPADSNDELSHKHQGRLNMLVGGRSTTRKEIADFFGRTPAEVADALAGLGLPGRNPSDLLWAIFVAGARLQLSAIIDIGFAWFSDLQDDRYIPNLVKYEVVRRDGFRCRYCGIELDPDSITFDHVIPVSQGGASVAENLAIACMPCNLKKGARRPAEAGMKLRKALFFDLDAAVGQDED